ncbi:MAG: rhomboid family intramembrane serine protease [Planctomycetes bacterium]|nr:rhomboid family intramembrane serine protease [Planctomycetota bacterium]
MLPIRTNIRPRQTPYANYVLIIVNVLIFLVSYPGRVVAPGVREVVAPWAQQFELVPNRPELWQFLSYAFLHGGYMHIIGNMLFLYIFGNNVNARLGHISYVSFYLGGAAFSGVGHAVIHSASSVPTLGASGAVAAVTGAYLVLFPQTLITVLYWFFFIGTIDVPALYFIGLKMILIDNVIAATSDHIAYDAHLAGYAFGIAAILGVLATGLVRSDNFDLWAMLRRWNRRRRYRDVVAGGYDPFTGQVRAKQVKAKQVKAKQVKTAAQKLNEKKMADIRNEIGKRMLERNLAGAAGLYLELMGLDEGQILPRQHLLDIANQLASDNRPAESARAYEQLLAHYSSYEYAGEVELMVGLLYSRYLDQRAAALKYLHAAAAKLSDPGQLKMCRDELARLEESGG